MIVIIDNHSKNIRYIKDILKKLHTPYIVKDQRSFFKDFEKYDINGVILSGGGPLLDLDIDFSRLRADLACLINLDVPVLGICLGYELIGEACGGNVLKLKKPSLNKKHKVKILNKNRIFKNLPDVIYVYEHHFRYLRDVPKVLEISARSKRDKIEAFFHKKKKLYGLQFHPEKSGKAGEIIFENFLNECYK